MPTHMEALNARITTLEATIVTFSQKDKTSEKQKFWKDVLESKAISNIGKLSSPSEDRMWNKKFKNASEQVRGYARKTIHWLETVKEKDILDELDVGPSGMTAAEAVVEQLRLEKTKDEKKRRNKVRRNGRKHGRTQSRPLEYIGGEMRWRSMGENQYSERWRRNMGV